MNIKKVIKLSFSFIIGLILIISSINILSIKKIESNAKFNNYISSLISIQEEINLIILEASNSKTTKSLQEYKEKLDKEEKKFILLEQTFLKHDKKRFLDDYIQDILKDSMVKENLVFLHENKEKMVQQYVKLKTILKKNQEIQRVYNVTKKRETNLQKSLKREILSLHNLALISDFMNIDYLRNEVIKNTTDKNMLKQLNQAIIALSQKTEIKEFKNYKAAINKRITYTKKLKNIRRERSKIQKELHHLIALNEKENATVKNDIKNVHDMILKENNFMLLVILGLTILFIILFAMKIYRHVGLSVDEIHEKIHEGTQEIETLNHEIEATQKEVVFTMGAIGESRSKETGNHVKRVAEYSKLLALYYGLPEDEAEMLKQASPMHDIGKVAIPDAVLNKPGRFDEAERKIMDTHAQLGFDMLRHSNRPLLKMAATVAYEHHEKWDGTGYPNKLKGEDIHIYGRITALADVFDALGSDRVYKKAWDDERIFNLFKEERAKHFDPKLIDIFFEHLEEFLTIRETFKDKF